MTERRERVGGEGRSGKKRSRFLCLKWDVSDEMWMY